MDNILRFDPAQVEGSDRFARFRLIHWWEQERLARSRVLVVGAGALGNEILKNLALLGLGRIFVVDLDDIEHSNLSRSVLFREEDNGRAKAEAAAQAVRTIWPSARVHGLQGNILSDLGLGVFVWADVILAGLDNREARLFVNRSCAKVGRDWIDGAIEQLNGLARVFRPSRGPCYECTLGQVDWDILKARRSCNFLTREDILQGRVPTTPTSASIIAGIQCQEAVKLLHGLPTLEGRAFLFNGLTHESYVVSYERKPDCFGHEPLGPVSNLGRRASHTTAAQLLGIIRAELGPEAVVDLGRDIVLKLDCQPCGTSQAMFRQLQGVTEQEAVCPSCGLVRNPILFHTLTGDEDFLDKTMTEIGLPAFDIVTGRMGAEERAFLFDADGPDVLGPLADAEDLETRDRP